jgi:hypothetical protein
METDMSELTWDQAVELIDILPSHVMQVMRNEAVESLLEFIGDSGDIGSSDINGQVVPRIMRGNFSDNPNNDIISLFVGMSAQKLGMELPYELPNKVVG